MAIVLMVMMMRAVMVKMIHCKFLRPHSWSLFAAVVHVLASEHGLVNFLLQHSMMMMMMMMMMGMTSLNCCHHVLHHHLKHCHRHYHVLPSQRLAVQMLCYQLDNTWQYFTRTFKMQVKHNNSDPDNHNGVKVLWWWLRYLCDDERGPA